MEQRAGRIIRQGNTNETVHIYRYVTKDTFDSYSYQLVENKQKFIS
ncbi:MAG: helicase, partial [Candidatus Ornithomonoglobus sp.]